MSGETKPVSIPKAIEGTATAPLLYWLAVVCGLTGITVIRMDEPAKVVPIWFGAIVGISLGQLVAVLRIRVWTTALVVLMSSWILGPALYIGLCELFGFGADTETALMALIPAFVCGYASLSERGGLLAFWYPAMLWMLVILDGEAPGSFAPRAYLPMAIGLGVFFVAFLRARATRRAALWRAYSHVRLATPTDASVALGSPVRSLSQLAFTSLVGGGTFLLAAWVAPNLFQKDHAIHQKMAQVPPSPRYDNTMGSNLPCCPESWETEKVREYMPLKNEHDAASARARLQCTYCPVQSAAEEPGPYASYRGSGVRTMNPTTHYGYDFAGYGYGVATTELTYAYNADGTTTYGWTTNPGNGTGTPNYGANTDSNTGSTANYGYGYGTNYDYHPTPTYAEPTPVVPVVPVPVAPDPPKPVPVVTKKPKKPTPVAVAPTPVPVPVVTHAPVPKPVVVAETPKAPPPQVPAVVPASHPVRAPEPSAPWGILLPLMAGVFVLPLGSRWVRRHVTLRHLTRPIWRETVDQQISNHWQRILVGLRDAGIQMRSTEQPGAFAKRVGIKGMDECATILERTRHGVRIEDEDLSSMGKATAEIYGTARKRAGVAGRVAGAFRWPLV